MFPHIWKKEVLPGDDTELLKADGTTTQMCRAQFTLIYSDIQAVHTNGDTLKESTCHQEL